MHAGTSTAQPAVVPSTPGRLQIGAPELTYTAAAPRALPATDAAATLPMAPGAMHPGAALPSATLHALTPASAATAPSTHRPAADASAHSTTALPLNQLADRIFHLLERRLVIERERRGLRS